ncbi:MAG: hypothetical protein WD021_09550 [Rhodothermales bacterium]
MSDPILQQLFDLGEKMKNALESGEINTYYDLVGERGTLLDTLESYRHPSDVASNWKEMATALADQNDELMEAAETEQRRIRDAITRFEQVRSAQRSYLHPTGRSNILNENLRV